MKTGVILLTLNIFLVSCGIKGPPMPPENNEIAQETVQKQKNSLVPSASTSADQTPVKKKK